jgi:hypothetical protein
MELCKCEAGKLVMSESIYRNSNDLISSLTALCRMAEFLWTVQTDTVSVSVQ